jgi:hypothetical protein
VKQEDQSNDQLTPRESLNASIVQEELDIHECASEEVQ